MDKNRKSLITFYICSYVSIAFLTFALAYLFNIVGTNALTKELLIYLGILLVISSTFAILSLTWFLKELKNVFRKIDALGIKED